MFRCFFRNCIPPPDPNTIPPPNSRPEDFIRWSAKDSWENMDEGWGGNLGDGKFDFPKDGDNVKIKPSKWSFV